MLLISYIFSSCIFSILLYLQRFYVCTEYPENIPAHPGKPVSAENIPAHPGKTMSVYYSSSHGQLQGKEMQSQNKF